MEDEPLPQVTLSNYTGEVYEQHLLREGQTHRYRVRLSDCGYRPLYYRIGEKPLMVVFSLGFRSVVETSTWMRDNLGIETLWISRTVQGFRREPALNLLGADLRTAVKALEMRRNLDNVVVLMVHMAAPHTGVWRCKMRLPKVKVISLLYDVMTLWLPRDKHHLWDEYIDAKGSNEGEYEALEDILAAKYVDGVIYKDWGDQWPYMDKTPCPKLWFPSTVPEKLFQPPPPPNVPDRFCFVGTIMPRRTHDRPAGLFSDIFMNNVFRQVANQGYDIHAYVMRPDPDVVEEYAKEFTGGRVRLFPGAHLQELMFRIARRYRWGWMMYEYPCDLIMPLVENSLPTKLFTYMALGLPTVVSEEMAAVARFVREHGIGVVVSQEDQKNLKPILDSYNYEEMLANIVKVRQEYSLEKHIGNFGNFVKQIMEGPCKPPPKDPKFVELEEKFIEQKKKQVRPIVPEEKTRLLKRQRSSWIDDSGDPNFSEIFGARRD